MPGRVQPSHRSFAQIIATLLAVLVATAAAVPANSQMERYNADTGKYTTNDPFKTNDPLNTSPPARPSPYRLNNSIAKRTTGPDRTTSAAGQRNTRSGVVGNRQKTGATSAPQTSSDSASGTWVTMGDMSMYDPNGAPDDPFAKPDWWPK